MTGAGPNPALTPVNLPRGFKAQIPGVSYLTSRARFFGLLSAALAAATLLASATPATPAFAAGRIPSNTIGTDISWPQCGTAYPTGYQWAVIGVNGGAPFSTNPCLASEFHWSQTETSLTQLYINLDFGQIGNWPLRCDGADQGCQAYNYGYDAAKWSWDWAHAATGGVSDVISTWWLDVETENVWSDDTNLNSYVIQGAIDYLSRVQGRPVGIYSTAYQWGEIAGTFAPPGIGNWVAGASSVSDNDHCHWGLWPGGQVWAIQYLNWDLNLDQDGGC